MPPNQVSFWLSLPAWLIRPPPKMIDCRYGSRHRPRPSSVITDSTSTPPPPKPPSSSEKGTAVSPSSLSCFQKSTLNPASVSLNAKRFSKLYSPRTRRATVSCSICCSSFSRKSMVASLEPENHLRHDIFLDLVGSAENRELTVIEVLS